MAACAANFRRKFMKYVIKPALFRYVGEQTQKHYGKKQ
jgi:hypothetical protein